MKIFETVVLNSIFLTFPLIVYLLYLTYSRALSKERNELYLDVALISSFYLIVRYGFHEMEFVSLLLLNIPLIAAYMKDRKLSAIFLSVLTIFYYKQVLAFPLIPMIIEYVVYYLMFLYAKKGTEKMEGIMFISLGIKCVCFVVMYLVKESLSSSSMIYLGISLFVYFVETILVIYALKQSEAVIRLYKMMENLQEEKQIRDSLFKITHEIKNPIAVCKGYLDMFDVNNIEHGRKYIPIMKEEIGRVLILLQDFLSVSKIKIEPDIIDINLLLNEVINSFLPLLNAQKISVDFKDSKEEVYLFADYNRLSQVFVNILKNGIEALENIPNGRIQIRISEGKGFVRVHIVDNGIGIDKEDLNKMKQPFFTTKRNGTGLGIYLSNEIIKAHGGTIQYKSSNHKTEVIVTIPNKKGY